MTSPSALVPTEAEQRLPHRIRHNPELFERFEPILVMASDTSQELDAHSFEEALNPLIAELGNASIAQWAAGFQERLLNQARSQPEGWCQREKKSSPGAPPTARSP